MMQEDESLLARISGPADIKDLSLAELKRLAEEIRRTIIGAVSRNGGHLASNLGVVELTIALHRVWNSPEDKIVWDTGHQCYAHKLLTGRREEFARIRQAGGLAGFPKRSESPHDAFDTGHASTSISASLGLLAGDRLLGGKSRVVAVIGDGALTGGLAYEALSHAGQIQLPLVVILNDNKMSIGPNVGGLSKYLSRLSMKAKYQSFRRKFDAMTKKIPFAGEFFFDLVVRLKRAVKAVFYTDNFFVDLGFEYVGPIDGHHLQTLINVLKDAKNLDKPVVVHVITRKGKGYGFAEDDPLNYHGVSAFPVEEGVLPGKKEQGEAQPLPSFTDAFGRALLEAARRDRRVTAITAAMEKGTGLAPFKKEFPERFFDVGIAEGHEATFAAGLAAAGLKPVAAVYSTFVQRAMDGVIHDICLQKLPVVFALDRAGFVSDDGETHQGLYDLSLFRAAPGMTILAPAGEGELRLMLDWALREGGPVSIRYPKALCPPEDPAFLAPMERGRGAWLRKRPGAEVCIAFSGGLYPEALDGAERLAAAGREADLYNLRFLKPVDEDYLCMVMDSYRLVVFAEEGTRPGGFGEYASSLARARGCAARIISLAAGEGGPSLGKREELLRLNGLDGKAIAEAAYTVRRPL